MFFFFFPFQKRLGHRQSGGGGVEISEESHNSWLKRVEACVIKEKLQLLDIISGLTW